MSDQYRVYTTSQAALAHRHTYSTDPWLPISNRGSSHVARRRVQQKDIVFYQCSLKHAVDLPPETRPETARILISPAGRRQFSEADPPVQFLNEIIPFA